MKKYFILIIAMTTYSCSQSNSGGNIVNTSESFAVNHLVGTSVTDYFETADTTNNVKSSAENTNYILDKNGLRLTGTFGSNSVVISPDYFQFYTGSFQKVSMQVYIDGQAVSDGTKDMFISLGALVYNGYSNLLAGATFNRAWVLPNTQYSLQIYPYQALLGKTYTVEIIGVE